MASTLRVVGPERTVVVGAAATASEIGLLVEPTPVTALGVKTAVSGPGGLAASNEVTHVVVAMQRGGVRRLSALGAAGTSGDAFGYQSALSRFLFTAIGATLLKWPFRSQQAMHRIIMESGLEWTIVEPPRLLNGPRTGKYRVQADAMPPKSSSIHRGDVADFMLKQLTSKEWVGKTPFIAD